MTRDAFEHLVQIMETLRGPDGCPWDREQDLKSLQPMLIEEVYEVVEAVDAQDWEALEEELGDLLLHVVFHARLGQEAERFDIQDVIEGIAGKLIRRHPHVFGDTRADDAATVVDNWEALKEQERRDKELEGPEEETPARRGVLDGVPPRLPALYEAHKISSRVARVGFDWPDLAGVFEKLAEEVRELQDAIDADPSDTRGSDVEEELGDILFVVVNLARRLGVDSESALKRANRKFRDRFRYLEQELARRGRTPEESTLEEMDSVWSQAKRHAGG